MRTAAFALSAVLLLAASGMQAAAPLPDQAGVSPQAITHCAEEGASIQGVCSPASLDSTLAQVLSYKVYAGACPDADLHVVRYLSSPGPGQTALDARWCN
jgi:hypothetical protein